MIADQTATQMYREEFRELVDLYRLALDTEAIDAAPVLEETLSTIAGHLGMAEEYTVLRHPPRFIEGSETEIITPTRTITGRAYSLAPSCDILAGRTLSSCLPAARLHQRSSRTTQDYKRSAAVQLCLSACCHAKRR